MDVTMISLGIRSLLPTQRKQCDLNVMMLAPYLHGRSIGGETDGEIGAAFFFNTSPATNV
jgi:hypothetical protein